MQILIDAGKWQAGYDMDSGRIGKQIEFMKGWSIEDIREYCKNKQWKLQEIGEPMVLPDYGYYD